MRSLATTPVSPSATPVTNGGRPLPSSGAELRVIIGKAIAMRRTIMHARAGHRGGPELWMSLGRLQQWLERNPYPSPMTVRCFNLYPDLALVMPGTTGGRKLLAQARTILL